MKIKKYPDPIRINHTQNSEESKKDFLIQEIESLKSELKYIKDILSHQFTKTHFERYLLAQQELKNKEKELAEHL